MSSVVLYRTLRLDAGNCGSLATCGSDVYMPYNGDLCAVAYSAHSGERATVRLNQTARNDLYPNDVAHPTRIGLNRVYKKLGLSGDNYIYFRWGGVTALTQRVSGNGSEASDLTGTEVTGSARSTDISFELIHGGATGIGVEYLEFSMYFTRHDFAASAGIGVASTNVSSPTGFDGDNITFSCVLPSGAEFDGWYSGATRVSTSQTYTVTVNGEDMTLEARAKRRLSVTYGSQTILSFGNTAASVGVYYNGSCITSIGQGGTKTLKTGGKVMRENLLIEKPSVGEIGFYTLNCAKKKMATDVVITYT